MSFCHGMHLKMSAAKWWLFRLGRNVLRFSSISTDRIKMMTFAMEFPWIDECLLTLRWYVVLPVRESHCGDKTIVRSYLYNMISHTGPCLTTAIWRCRNPFSKWERNFQRKLCSHWLKCLRQRHVAVVRQGPGKTAPTFWIRPRFNVWTT